MLPSFVRNSFLQEIRESRVVSRQQRIFLRRERAGVSPEWRPLPAVGEHGRRLGKDSSSRGGSFFRRRLPCGLAGEQNEKKVPRLEEKAAAGEIIGDSEEAGFSLMGKVNSTD